LSNVIRQLEERGLLEAVTAPEVYGEVEKPAVVYAGFDPTSDSLQVGNLVAIIGLAHFQRAGHRPVALVGGATALVGDPSGRSSERDALSSEQVARNVPGIRENLSRFLDFDHPTAPAKIVNNNDWMQSFTFVDFLRDVGRHFRLGTMLGKESVRARLGSEAGMSFAEFSYQALQGYDFLHLWDTEGCRLQIGGSDQWGNITAGIDLIHKLRGQSAFGLTFPLVCDSAGRKFGKSEGNAIYLDHRRTSYYDFYQFFLRTEDADAPRFLKIFTFLPIAEIDAIARESAAAPEKRIAQRRLAEEATRLVHGDEGLRTAQKASDVLFGGGLDGLGADELLGIFAHVPSTELARAAVVGARVLDVAQAAGLCASKGEARRLIESGGLYVNNVRAAGIEAAVSDGDLVDGRVLVLRSGKKTFHLVKVA
jgi:tyrosyl-tRNA synthetase